MGKIHRKAGAAAFLSGVEANRPGTSVPGAHYLALDSGKLWKWAGAWVLLGTLALNGSGDDGTPRLSRGLANPGKTYLFGTYASGNIAGQSGWTGNGAVSNAQLQVNTMFTVASGGARAPGLFTEGEIIASVDPQSPHLLIRANQSVQTGQSYAAWFYANQSGQLLIDAGVLSSTDVIVSGGASGPIIPVDAGQLLLRMVVERNVIYAWGWPSSQPMPVAPMVSFNVTGYPLGEGETVLSYTFNPARINSLRINAGNTPPNEVETQANFAGGRWYAAYRAGRLGMGTITQGSETLVRADGSDLTALVYRDPATTQTPYLSVQVNGGPPTRVLGPTTPGWSLVTFAANLSGQSDVRIVLDGFHELDPVWSGAALLMADFRSAGGTTVPLANGPLVVQVGDSITAGVLLRGALGGTSAANSGGSLTYGRLAAVQVGAQPVQEGYGGVGVAEATAGSGGVPGALKNQLLFYALRPDPGRYAAQVKAVTVNLGTNDAGRGISEAVFQTDYTSLLTLLKARYPNAKILALLPFNGVYASAIQAAVAAAGSRVQYVDTTGWVTTFTDGVHPDEAGHDSGAARLAPLLQAAIA